MSLDVARRKVQQEAIKAWIDNGKRGFIKAITGIGKSWIIYDAISLEPKDSRIILLSETHKRDKQIIDEAEPYMAHTGNKLDIRKVILETYQKAYKMKGERYGLVIADEADFIGLKYKEFFQNNSYERILMLSATRSESVKYYKDEMNPDDFITKGEILDSIAPVVFEYTVKQGLKDNTARDLDVVVLNHFLDNKSWSVKSPFSDKKYTEQKVYSMLNNRLEYLYGLSPSKQRFFAIRKWQNARARFLYGLPSKVERTRILLDNLDGRTLVLGNSLDALYSITQNTVSSRNSNELNKQLIADMKAKKIDVLAADKLLTRGMNFPDIDNIIMVSYNAASHALTQRIGRLRLKGDFKGMVYIFRTNDTREEDWFNKLLPVLSNYNLTYK